MQANPTAEEPDTPRRCTERGGWKNWLTVTCIECGDTLPEERAELGYRYCIKKTCQALHHRGVAITAIGVNKSADHFIGADADEVRRRGEAGEFGKKDARLGLDHDPRVPAPRRTGEGSGPGAGPDTEASAAPAPVDLPAGEDR